MKKLNIGSGQRPLAKLYNNWVDLDVRETVKMTEKYSYVPDIVADCREIPVEDGSFDEALAHSILEHFGKREVQDCLKEWRRILKKEGKMTISVPDMVKLSAEIIEKPGNTDRVRQVINLCYGEQDYPENAHKWGFTYDTLKEELERASFYKIRRLRSERYSSELLIEAYAR